MNLIKMDGVRAAPVKPFSELMRQWVQMVYALKVILMGQGAADGWGANTIKVESLGVWRWMWSLAPDTEARKAVFTAGDAAFFLVKYMAGDERAGRRAEELLRVLKWHTDDARGEQQALKHLVFVNQIDHNNRAYERPQHPSDWIYVGHRDIVMNAATTQVQISKSILDDHFDHQHEPLTIFNKFWDDGERLVQRFADTAIASLPDGPWVMTSADVSRFLLMISEDQ